MNIRLLLISWMLMLLVAGCGASDSSGELPTRVIVPEGDTPVAQADDVDAPTLPASWTPTLTVTTTLSPTITESPSVTPSMTITDTPRPTDTPTASPTLQPGGVNSIAELALQFTPLPTGLLENQPVPTINVAPPPSPVVLPTLTPAPGSILATPLPATACQFLPPGGFGQIIVDNPNLPTQIGCPLGSPPVTQQVSSAIQTFERGTMVWVGTQPGVIYVFYNNGVFQRFNDTYNSATDPESGGETPPDGLFEPVRGFGKVWRTVPAVRDGLGWATGSESGTNAVLQDFAQGRMIYVSPRGDTFVLTTQTDPASGIWQTIAGTF